MRDDWYAQSDNHSCLPDLSHNPTCENCGYGSYQMKIVSGYQRTMVQSSFELLGKTSRYLRRLFESQVYEVYRDLGVGSQRVHSRKCKAAVRELEAARWYAIATRQTPYGSTALLTI